MNKRIGFLWVFVSIIVIVSIPLLYNGVYRNISQIVIYKAAVSGRVIGISPAYVNGMITKMYVKEGDSIKKGQLIALVDDTLYRAELDKKKSVLNSLKAYLKQLDNATNSFRYMSLKRDVDVAAKDFKLAQLMLSYTRVASPVDGIVVKRMVNVGDTVSENQVLVYVLIPDTLYVKAFIEPDKLKYIHLDQTVKIDDVVHKKIYQGKITKIGGIDLFATCNRNKLVPIRVKIISKNAHLLFGQPVYLIIKR
ncbi:HlyD family secretion protein [Hippea jasoniae]|uniref:HlyD family secretion protein n=1 Tax=Hippea jasoniae TaxID=944479 RepID=UPI000555D04C|nr:HlyD family efflux transporter periplasmic adaptor subunit [Hippea jasoniae]